jgi:signal transduction histidine kinase/ActR/RegA family two-component response regulator
MEVDPIEFRVLVLASTQADARVSVRLFDEWGIEAKAVGSPSQLRTEIQLGAGAVVVTDDVMKAETVRLLRSELERQPSWSELPILLLARHDFPQIDAVRDIAGMVVLERPVHMRTLVSAVQAALRARLRQYELRSQLERTRAANLELRDAARAKDEFLATLSHELRNPLSALITAAALLDRDPSGPVAARQAREIVRRQATQMARLLDDLLDVSRIRHGRLEIQKSPCDVATLVHGAVETVQPLFARKNHEFVLTLPAQRITLSADPLRLSQVIANLLTNAAKYTEPGGRIELTVAVETGSVAFTVRDNGIGIDPKHVTDIFGMFSQLRPALERSEGGLGIGLALAKGLIDLHGGDIAAASDGVGRGSTFTVRIPHVEATPESPSTAEPQHPTKASAAHRDLIVADDNADAADSLANLLALEGHDVRVAHDGRSALQLAAERMPGIMLLDIGMPDINGYDVARTIREREPGDRVVLVALTGWGQPGDKRRAREAGFDHHLTKPVDFEELSTILTDAGIRSAIAPVPSSPCPR